MILTTDIIIILLSCAFLAMRDCEQTHQCACAATLWTLIAGGCLTALTYQSWISIVLAGAALMGGYAMFICLNRLKADLGTIVYG